MKSRYVRYLPFRVEMSLDRTLRSRRTPRRGHASCVHAAAGAGGSGISSAGCDERLSCLGVQYRLRKSAVCSSRRYVASGAFCLPGVCGARTRPRRQLVPRKLGPDVAQHVDEHELTCHELLLQTAHVFGGIRQRPVCKPSEGPGFQAAEWLQHRCHTHQERSRAAAVGSRVRWRRLALRSHLVGHSSSHVARRQCARHLNGRGAGPIAARVRDPHRLKFGRLVGCRPARILALVLRGARGLFRSRGCAQRVGVPIPVRAPPNGSTTHVECETFDTHRPLLRCRR